MEYKLSDVCSGITDGSHNPPAGISNSDYLMLSSKNIFDDEITFDAPRYLSEGQFVVENKRTRIKPGDILMTIVGTVGRTAIVPDGISTITLQRSVAVLHPLKDICFSRYLMYALRSKRKFFESEAHGVAQKGIYLKQLSNIIVDVPELERQEATVQILDFVQNIIKKRHEELDKLDELIKARFVEMFGDPVDNPKGWRMKKLQELVSDDCTISYGIVQTGDDQEEGIPVFRPVDIVDHVPTRSELKKTTEEISNKYKRTLLKGREMLITVRANIADTCIVGEEFVGCNVGRGIVPIRTNEDEMILEFLKHQIDSKHLNDNIKALAKGITLIQLNMEDLREISLIVPPKEQQKAYVEFAKQTDKSKYQAEPNSRKYYIHRLRKQYQELTDSLFLYFTKLFEVIIFQKGIC